MSIKKDNIKNNLDDIVTGGPTLLEEAPDDFEGYICDFKRELDTEFIKPSKSILLYFIRSLPTDQIQKDDPLSLDFQIACDTWTEYTGVKFQRSFSNSDVDFIIRSANEDEETERSNLVIDGFNWNSKGLKAVKIWKSIEKWNAYSIFLHLVGHILGFCHHHAFSQFGMNSSYIHYSETARSDSIMSYNYIKQFTKDNNDKAILSNDDKILTQMYYNISS